MLIGILVRQREKHSKDASVDSDSPHSSTSSKADKVVSSSAGNSDSGNTSSSSKVRASLSGARRDPRLAKLAAKAESVSLKASQILMQLAAVNLQELDSPN